MYLLGQILKRAQNFCDIIFRNDFWVIKSSETKKTPKRMNQVNNLRYHTPKKFIVLTAHLVLLGYRKPGGIDGLDMWVGQGRQGMHTEFLCGRPLAKHPFGRPRRKLGGGGDL
jgi:hypothetical protein